MLTFALCDQTYQNLQSFGQPAFSTFIDICRHYVSEKTHYQYDLFSHHNENEIINFLEKKGFIVTTEISQDFLSAIPIGVSFRKDYETGKHYMCICTCKKEEC